MNDSNEPQQRSSARIISLRLPADLQNKLQAAAVTTGLSQSQLLREGAEHVIEKYLGDAENVDQAVARAQERTADRIRVLLGSPKSSTVFEATREMLSFVVAELSRRVADAKVAGESAGELEEQLQQAIADQRGLDPSDMNRVERVRDEYGPVAAEMRDRRRTHI